GSHGAPAGPGGEGGGQRFGAHHLRGGRPRCRIQAGQGGGAGYRSDRRSPLPAAARTAWRQAGRRGGGGMSTGRLQRGAMLALLALLLTGCVSSPPDNPGNVCSIFEDRRSWYRAAKRSEERWQVPIPVNMAILYQESAYRGRAKPPRRYYLGFIPGPRPSNAYGYAQALDSTWNDYTRASGNGGARRSNFGDAVDFVGCYNTNSNRINGIARNDAY